MPTPEPLISFDAIDKFIYNDGTSDIEKIKKEKGITGLTPGPAISIEDALKDWNRSQKGEGLFYIIIKNGKNQEVKKSLKNILKEFNDEEKGKYQINNKNEFKTIQGLQLFWQDYLFYKVKDQEKLNILKNSKDLYQGGALCSTLMQAAIDLATSHESLTIPQDQVKKVIFYPTEEGVEIHEKQSLFTMYDTKQKMKEIISQTPILEFDSKISLTPRMIPDVKEEVLPLDTKGNEQQTEKLVSTEKNEYKESKQYLTKVTPQHIIVKIYDERLKDFTILGTQLSATTKMIQDSVDAFKANKKEYHKIDSREEKVDSKPETDSIERINPKKEMLDKLMEKICELNGRSHKNCKLYALFSIYQSFKNLDLSNGEDINKCKKIINDNLKNIEGFSSILGSHVGHLGAWIKQSIFKTGSSVTMSDTRLLVGKLSDWIEQHALPEERVRYDIRQAEGSEISQPDQKYLSHQARAVSQSDKEHLKSRGRR